MRAFVPREPGDPICRPPDVTVRSVDAWPSFGVVVDPMVLRSADVFLSGRSGDAKRDRERWKALSQNLTALVSFFDLLVFEEQIPMIDYGMTFDPAEGFEVATVYDMVKSLHGQLDDDTRKPLVTVHVEEEAAGEGRRVALEAMLDHGPIDPGLRESIAPELSCFRTSLAPLAQGDR